MQLVYQLAGAGWADARISHNSNYRDMAVSYLSDALGDMAQAALGLVRGAREVSFSFQDEPGEHRWFLNRGEADSLHIRILWFDDTFSRRPSERGEEVFSCDCAVLDFAGQVSHELHNILSENGVDGYKRRWQNHEFPLDAYTELQRLMTPQSSVDRSFRAEVLQQLREMGSDISREHGFDFYLYLPSESVANAAAEKVRESQFSAKVRSRRLRNKLVVSSKHQDCPRSRSPR